MHLHDWTRVDAGLFHDFHQGWTVALCNSLNSGKLPPSYFALLTAANGTLKGRIMPRFEADFYADKANRISVRNRQGISIAVIAIVSPGNKTSVAGFHGFVEELAEQIGQGIHAIVVDLFPTFDRTPHDIHRAIWSKFDGDLALPTEKPLTVVSYSAGPVKTAYVEPLAVGDTLPDMPLFLEPDAFVSAPLEATYRASWDTFPKALKRLLEP